MQMEIFFHSVATNINSNPDAWSHLNILDKDASTMIDLTSKLHLLFVQEILGSHRAMYEHFVQPVSDYRTEAENFLQDGFYNSSLGDLMPVAMATALQTIIVIITTNLDSDPLYAVPIVGYPDGTMFVLYHLFGTGHYDAAIPCCYEAVKHNFTPMKPLNMKISCSCGINTTESKSSCSPNPTYATHNKCYQKGLPCNSFVQVQRMYKPFWYKASKNTWPKKRTCSNPPVKNCY